MTGLPHTQQNTHAQPVCSLADLPSQTGPRAARRVQTEADQRQPNERRHRREVSHRQGRPRCAACLPPHPRQPPPPPPPPQTHALVLMGVCPAAPSIAASLPHAQFHPRGAIVAAVLCVAVELRAMLAAATKDLLRQVRNLQDAAALRIAAQSAAHSGRGCARRQRRCVLATRAAPQRWAALPSVLVGWQSIATSLTAAASRVSLLAQRPEGEAAQACRSAAVPFQRTVKRRSLCLWRHKQVRRAWSSLPAVARRALVAL